MITESQAAQLGLLIEDQDLPDAKVDEIVARLNEIFPEMTFSASYSDSGDYRIGFIRDRREESTRLRDLETKLKAGFETISQQTTVTKGSFSECIIVVDEASFVFTDEGNAEKATLLLDELVTF